ncbi:hypothetical protein ASE00_01945 [Sphingomonas sp. Root710]|uniref:hypothetical protein n=1 Tax=Sphingomonas sp. Root710 TaxID=1736594 RepID=UPI0006F72E48|nr:hypothetical protein [Sphingomonas sp. Root710]KRB85582.1 hypothetical protein ASE00_01945 [Sphingomonas sp. Root710]
MPTQYDVGSAPCLVVGRDRAGHWLVREIHGLLGGIFVSREAALHFARQEGSALPGATIRLSRGRVASFETGVLVKAA